MKIRTGLIFLGAIVALSGVAIGQTAKSSAAGAAATAASGAGSGTLTWWQQLLQALVPSVQEGLNSVGSTPKEEFKYETEEQLTKDLAASLKAGMVRVRVNIPGFDQQDTVPSVRAFAEALKSKGGRIIACKLNQPQAGPLAGPLVGLLAGYLAPAVKQAIDNWNTQLHLPEYTSQYHLLYYVRGDGQTLEYLLFRKKSLGTRCEASRAAADPKNDAAAAKAKGKSK